RKGRGTWRSEPLRKRRPVGAVCHPASMIQISGDSSRDGCWGRVLLRVAADRIVEADADGLDADLRGLSLLEAASVGGETLAVDALGDAGAADFPAHASAPPV